MECLVYFRSMHLKTAKKKIDKLISHSVFWRKMKCHAENKGIKVMQKKQTKKLTLIRVGVSCSKIFLSIPNTMAFSAPAEK